MPIQKPPVFVMPHYCTNDRRASFLERTVVSLFQQTDSQWELIIVNDGCNNPVCEKLIKDLSQDYCEQISVVTLPNNYGPGVARNVGVRSAASADAPYVMFQDDDDLAHPRRVEVTNRILSERPDVGFIYSGFVAIDQHDSVLPQEDIRLDMLEVLEALEAEIVQGDKAWIRIATSTGFIATTSTVAVRTQIALAVPFPDERVSEDSHTWLRMSASGARFAFASEIPTCYRMDAAHCSELGCNGREQSFLRLKVRNDIDGFNKAVAIALQRREISSQEAAEIAASFYCRLAVYVERQGDQSLGQKLRQRSSRVEANFH